MSLRRTAPSRCACWLCVHLKHCSAAMLSCESEGVSLRKAIFCSNHPQLLRRLLEVGITRQHVDCGLSSFIRSKSFILLGREAIVLNDLTVLELPGANVAHHGRYYDKFVIKEVRANGLEGSDNRKAFT